MPSSDIGSARTLDFRREDRLCRLGLHDCGGVSIFLSSDSESTQNRGSVGYLVDLSDFIVPSYGSGSDVRPDHETEHSPSRKSETDP